MLFSAISEFVHASYFVPGRSLTIVSAFGKLELLFRLQWSTAGLLRVEDQTDDVELKNKESLLIKQICLPLWDKPGSC